MILLLTDTSIGSQSQKAQSIQKNFHFIRLCRAFFAIHFGKKIFWISLRSDDVIVKMLNTVKYRVAENVCNIVCFASIFARLTVTISISVALSNNFKQRTEIGAF